MRRPTWKLTLGKLDRYGRKQVRTIKLTVDVLDFKDCAGFGLLLMAANPDLSSRDLQAVLTEVGPQHERPLGYISRRRWLFQGKGEAGRKSNADGLDEKARAIMAENPHKSSRQLAYLLREHGIPRSLDWVRKNRTLDKA